MKRKTLAAATVLGLCAVWSTQSSGGPRWLDQVALTEFYQAGFTVEHDEGWRLTSKADGSMTFTKGDYSDSGKWRIGGDRVCSRWRKIRDRVEACFRVAVEGDSYIWEKADGSHDTAKITARGE